MQTKAELIEYCKRNNVKGYSKFNKKDLQKFILDDLQKKMSDYWKATEVERKRSHTGKMYKEYLKKEKKR